MTSTVSFCGTSKLYHPIYLQSAEACSGPRLPTESDREVAWNHIHDCYAHDALNIYRECGSSAYMTDHRVHDNWFEDLTGVGIRCGDYVVGENWFYNNVVVNAGLGPDPINGDQAYHIPVYIHAGWDDTTTTIHFYNNTIIGGGWSVGATWSYAMVGFDFGHPMEVDFRNNIIVSSVPGIPYYHPSFAPPSNGVQNNIWYGAGAAPTWDNAPINADPEFIDPGNFDFSLAGTSPALDAAFPAVPSSTLPLPGHDMLRVPRPQGAAYDIGAIERDNISTGVPLIATDDGLIVHPNPASDQITLLGVAPDGTAVRVLDAMGRERITRSAMPFTMRMDISGLPCGAYVLGTRDMDGKRSVVRLIVQR